MVHEIGTEVAQIGAETAADRNVIRAAMSTKD
jgi:hypothetical protein